MARALERDCGLLIGWKLPDFPRCRKSLGASPQGAAGGGRRRRNSNQPETAKPEIAYKTKPPNSTTAGW